MTAALARLNALPAEKAGEALLACCGSRKWAARMVAARPFDGLAELLEKVDSIWEELGTEDWLEAFRHHPRIGDREPAAEASTTARGWSAQEQSGTQTAKEEVLKGLGAANSEYEAKYGFIFIVFATGKSKEEMLAILRERLRNDRETELRNAAEAQRQITRLRLEKLLNT